MAEVVLFSVASKLLSTISSPAFKFAYEKGLSIWGAMNELEQLKTTIQTVQAVLIDAERKQEGSAAVKNWIRRVGDVLYEADDLFDEVVTDGMLKQQAKAYKPLRKVQVSLTKLNPIISRNSIATKVKAIRKRLSDISTDMSGFQFVLCHKEDDIHTSRIGGERERGCFVDSKKVIGRDEDKKSILEMMLLKELDNHDEPVVISIVGIGGMGKTTLAQLVYNDDQVKNIFPHRWFACISDTTNEKEVIGKIFQSICDETYSDCTISKLQTKIRESIEGKKFLLVLDDVWDDDRSRWEDRLSLLSGSAKESKIIVTTRSSSVGVAMGALKTHHLCGLSDNDSWELFQRVAFPPEKENDKKWVDVGREIVKKCANVPLAIRSIGGLLYTKNTLREWESFRDSQLSNQSGDPVMKALKVSYDPLPSNLKHCFAYCSLFPKDYEYKVQFLIYLWIAQGYIKPNNEMQTVEEVGHLYLMDLLRRGFFQKEAEDEYGEIKSCKMHDLLHDLAQTVAGEEIEMVNVPPSNQSKLSARHVGVGSEGSWEIVAPLLDINRVRSVVFTVEYEEAQLALDRRFVDLKCLRALSLQYVAMDNVSSCIGELKHLRYLDLSGNDFKSLPESITKLLNLVTLILIWNESLIELPNGFRELINLRFLNIGRCRLLKHMPPGMGELTSLQYLTTFKVGKAIEGVEASGLDELPRLEQLKGKLLIEFDRESIEDWNGDDDSCWKLPVSPNELQILFYPGVRVPHWDRANQLSFLPNLSTLALYGCVKLKYLPPLCCLPNLTYLNLMRMYELEYVEEEEEEERSINNSSFFPCLEWLRLEDIPKLKGWKREVKATTSSPKFPSLSTIHLRIRNDDCIVQQLLSNSPSLGSFTIEDCDNLNNLHMESPHLRRLAIWGCKQLKTLHIAHPTVLEELNIYSCPEFDKQSLDGDLFPNLSEQSAMKLGFSRETDELETSYSDDLSSTSTEHDAHITVIK